jgi:hypothetical protein
MNRRGFFRLLPAVPAVTLASVASAAAKPKIEVVEIPPIVPGSMMSSGALNAKFQALQDAVNALIRREQSP